MTGVRTRGPGSPPPLRRSPVELAPDAVATERRGDWEVAIELEGEGDGPWLIDLSHRARWDYQDAAIDDHRPLDLPVPPLSGLVTFDRSLIISRMNQTQVSIGHVGPGNPPPTPEAVAYTDTTDSHGWMAVVGATAPAALERVSNLDLFPPHRRPPYLIQGPILHVSCQVITLGSDCALIALARGFSQSFVDALLDAASDLGIRPGGEKRFTDWLAT